MAAQGQARNVRRRSSAASLARPGLEGYEPALVDLGRYRSSQHHANAKPL